MSLIVQKYGGAALKNKDAIKSVAERIAALHYNGNQLIVVVSAKSGITTKLINDAFYLNSNAQGSLLDMLLVTGEQESAVLLGIALKGLGVAVDIKFGTQTGILTDEQSNNANVISLKKENYHDSINSGKVIIVAGYQGVNRLGELTTLGLGGSDLSAVVIAHFLKAERCQILKDVGGIFRADPKIVPEAEKFEAISHDDLVCFSRAGANVVQSKAVVFARDNNLEFEVANFSSNRPGTMVSANKLSFNNEWGLVLNNSNALLNLEGYNSKDACLKLKEIFKSNGASYEVFVENFDRVILSLDYSPINFISNIKEVLENYKLSYILKPCKKLSIIGPIGEFNITEDLEVLCSKKSKNSNLYLLNQSEIKNELNSIYTSIKKSFQLSYAV